MNRIIPDDLLPGTRLLNHVQRIREDGTMESVGLETISSKTIESLEAPLSGRTPKDTWNHFTDVMAMMKKITIMLNAYLIISYEPESGEPWLELETAAKYELKVSQMMTLASQHGMQKFTDVVNREFEIRESWRSIMIREKKTFNEAVVASIESAMWPASKELKMMAGRQT